MYWLIRTKAGIAIGYAALLGLLVGAVITAQTLYSATAANAKEFAILLALGIPRWRISVMVLAQSFWVGVIGVALAYPVCLGAAHAAPGRSARTWICGGRCSPGAAVVTSAWRWSPACSPCGASGRSSR